MRVTVDCVCREGDLVDAECWGCDGTGVIEVCPECSVDECECAFEIVETRSRDLRKSWWWR